MAWEADDRQASAPFSSYWNTVLPSTSRSEELTSSALRLLANLAPTSFKSPSAVIDVAVATGEVLTCATAPRTAQSHVSDCGPQPACPLAVPACPLAVPTD